MSPEGYFAVWELPCRSIVGFGWVGQRNASGRGSRGAGIWVGETSFFQNVVLRRSRVCYHFIAIKPPPNLLSGV